MDRATPPILWQNNGLTIGRQKPGDICGDCGNTDYLNDEQDGRFFHGFCWHYCFLPLLCVLRPSVTGELSSTEQHRRRQAQLGDSLFIGQAPATGVAEGGFCRWKMLRWCDRHEVGYIVGVPKNKRLNRLTATLQDEAAACFAATGHKVR